MCMPFVFYNSLNPLCMFLCVSRSTFVCMSTLQGEGQQALPQGPTDAYCCEAAQ